MNLNSFWVLVFACVSQVIRISCIRVRQVCGKIFTPGQTTA